MEGKLAEYDIDGRLQTLDEICDVLPLTLIEQLTPTSIRAAKHGGIRGVANVLEYSFSLKGFSQKVSRGVNYVVYYGGMFTLNYMNHFSNLVAEDMPESQRMTTAAYYAAWDTGQLALTQGALNRGCQFVGWASQKARQYGWHKTGNFLQGVSYYGGYGVYAYQTFTQGPLQAGVSVASGIAGEFAVGTAAELAVNKTLTGNVIIDNNNRANRNAIGSPGYLQAVAGFFGKVSRGRQYLASFCRHENPAEEPVHTHRA